ncbi:hypothetical protein ACTJIX_02130 [Acinetobacter sp. 22323]|uniref:hypothetical protein n=1 Tax=Acinetobacter TaxID=469 RepID=UPI0032B3EB0F
MSIDLDKMMTPDEIHASGINKLSESEQQEILRWGLRMYGLGQHKVGDIHEIKYEGRVIVLDDGSRWEVASYDASTVDFWGEFTKVAIIDDEMYRLEECVSVSEDFI